MGAALASLFMMVAQAADKRPNPPSPLCIGSNCVTAPPIGAKIKWNPGHYAAGNGSMFGDTKASSWYMSMDTALANYPLFKGFRMWITWSQIEKAKGVYDFTELDNVLNRLKNNYGTPRHLVITLYPTGPVPKWNGTSDTRVFPAYIYQDKAYGVSPVSGSYGFWAVNVNGTLGAYIPALWRPAVMDRYIALVQALAAHYDNDPYFEALMFQEGIYHVVGGSAPDYSNDAMTAQVKRLLTASTAAFAHTSVVFENTWGLGTPTQNQNFEAWMVDNRVAPGTADVIGESAFLLPMTRNRPNALNWGMAAYMGMTDIGSSYSGTDLRTKSRAMVDIEADDIAGPYYGSSGGPFTPADICAALNSRYKASHAFWDHFMGTEKVRGVPIPDAAKWPNLAAALAKCPLTNTSYPPNYPQ